MCSKFLKEEFQLKNLGLNHQHPYQHVISQCGPRQLHIVWSTVWGIYHLVILLIVDPYLNIRFGNRPAGLWFTYFTNWSYILLTLTTTIDMISAYYVHLKRKDIIEGACDQMPWYLKVLWVFVNLSHTGGLMATVGYYVFPNPEFNFESVAFHMINSIYILPNIFVSAKPMRILHFYQPLILILIYGAFNAGYQRLGGDAIYPVLDLSDVTRATLCIIGIILIGAPLIHIILFIFHKLRIFVASKCCRSSIVAENACDKDNEVV